MNESCVCRTSKNKFLTNRFEGDPEVLDSFRYPNLSGEFAGDPTPQSLCDDLGIEYEVGDDDIDIIIAEYEKGIDETFLEEVERLANQGLE